MTYVPSAVAHLVAMRLLVGASFDDLCHAAEAAGHDLADVLDVLAAPFDHLTEQDAAEVEDTVVYCWADLLYELVEYSGAEAATKIARRSSAFAEVDVRLRHGQIVAWLRAQAAITDEEPLATIYGLVADSAITEPHRTQLVERLARVYPEEELAAIVDAVTPADAAVIGRVLCRHQTPLAALESLLRVLPPEEVLGLLTRFWDVTRPEGDALSALLEVYSALCHEECRPLTGALRFAVSHGAPAWWLPILREGGLKGSQCALTLLESGVDRLAIANLLATAGYSDDDVLTALLENGIGTRRSLATLRESGWGLDVMVAALARRGALPPEVRTHMEELGVPRQAQRPLLLAHWPAPVVELILAETNTHLLLPAGGGGTTGGRP